MTGYTAILSRDPDSGDYTAICPAMPGAIAEAPTREAVLAQLALVMRAWLDLAAPEGRTPEQEDPRLLAEKVAEVLEDRREEGWDLRIETVTVEPAVRVAA